MNQNHHHHQLTASDMARMRVPLSFYGVVPEQFHPRFLKPAMRNYFRMWDECWSKGVGFFFWGSEGTGKTSAAVWCLKLARTRFKTGLFIRPADLREGIRNNQMFDADTSIYTRARTVDALVIDGFESSDFNLPYFGLNDLYRLVMARGDDRRCTFITSRASPGMLDQGMTPSTFFAGSGGYALGVHLEGESLRRSAVETWKQSLFSVQPDPPPPPVRFEPPDLD